MSELLVNYEDYTVMPEEQPATQAVRNGAPAVAHAVHVELDERDAFADFMAHNGTMEYGPSWPAPDDDESPEKDKKPVKEEQGSSELFLSLAIAEPDKGTGNPQGPGKGGPKPPRDGSKKPSTPGSPPNPPESNK